MPEGRDPHITTSDEQAEVHSPPLVHHKGPRESMATLEDIARVKTEYPIEDIVTQFCVLRHDGYQRYKTLCPLHQERTASFTVTSAPDGGRWYCYGCHRGGDVFDFLRLKEGLHFLQAYAYLTGLPSQPSSRSHAPASYTITTTSSEQQIARDVALQLYQADLLNAVGEHARNYLTRRGINDLTIRMCGLGWCEGQHTTTICATLASQNIPVAAAHDAGILRGAGHVERFIGRIVVPEQRAGHTVWLTSRTPTDTSITPFVNAP